MTKQMGCYYCKESSTSICEDCGKSTCDRHGDRGKHPCDDSIPGCHSIWKYAPKKQIGGASK
jgi:uncharacterized UBP type Zn finger protein